MTAPTQPPTEGVRVAPRPNRAAVNGIREPAHGCEKCEKRWNGFETCHCRSCHHSFDSPEAFDLHRAGSYARERRYCRPPADVGLVDARRAYPCWTHPDGEAA